MGWQIAHNEIYSEVPTVYGIAVQGWFGDLKTVENQVEFNTVSFTGTDIHGDRHVGMFLAGFGVVTEHNTLLNNRVIVDITPPEGQETWWDYSVGIWLFDYDAYNHDAPVVVKRNRIVGNKFEAASPLVIQPAELASVRYHNVISENLGDLRVNEKKLKK